MGSLLTSLSVFPASLWERCWPPCFVDKKTGNEIGWTLSQASTCNGGDLLTRAGICVCLFRPPWSLCSSATVAVRSQEREGVGCSRYESYRIPAMTSPRLVVTSLNHLVTQLLQLTNWSCGQQWGDMGTKLDISHSLIWKVFLCSHLT